MIMINELVIMITIIFIMKVMIIRNKQMNKNNNTTTNLCGNKINIVVTGTKYALHY